MIEKDRYVARKGPEPGQWQAYDTRVNAPVYGAESMAEATATDYARKLNDTYREFRRAARRCPVRWSISHTLA